MKKFLKRSFAFFSVLILLGIVIGFVNKPSTQDALDAGFSSVQELNTYKAAGYDTKLEFDATGFVNLDEASKYNLVGFSSLEEFKVSGFTSLQEATQYKSIGFDTKDSYDKSGFSSFEEAKEYVNAGFESKTAYEESGFLSFDESKEFRDAGYSSKHKFLKTGFIDLKQAAALKSYGSTHDEAVAAKSKVSLAEFKSCDRAGGSTYKNECFGKDVIWYAKIDRYADSGTYLDVVENCADNSSNSKSAWSKELSYDFWKQNDGACVQILANIRDENWATPTIVVEKVLWAESLDSKNKRIEAEEKLAEQQRIREEKQKAAELEQNKFNPEWLSDKFGIAGGVKCKPLVESLAKHTYRWTDGWLDTKFPSYLVSNKGEPFVLTLVGDKIEFQNGFGAWSKMKYYCKYNAKTKKVLDVWAN